MRRASWVRGWEMLMLGSVGYPDLDRDLALGLGLFVLGLTG